jgi:hypothetical protein
MSELTDTFGSLKKDTIVRIDGVDMAIEDVWRIYHSVTLSDVKYPGVEFSPPNKEIKLMAFDGEKFINQPIKRLIRHKIFSCATDVTLSNGFKISVFDKCKLLSENGFTNKFRRGLSIAIPKEFYISGKSYYVDTQGNLYLTKTVNLDFTTVNDYTYTFEVDRYHNFVANGIVSADFIESNS